MFDFTDQVAVVTGAAGNLGLAVAQAFHQAGGKLVLMDVNYDRLEQMYGEMAEKGDALLATVNLLDAAAVDALFAEAINQFGRLDILTNIAGGFSSGPRLHETPLETWDFMFDLNAKTVFHTCRAAIPHLLAQKRGKIINVAARAGLEGKAKMGPYTASKSAVIRLTETLASELKGEGINVNCILPGTIDTPRNRLDMPNADFSHWVAPSDLAAVILFLSSEAARAIHGAALPVYGLS
ncbi:MAG: SDR family oxidoreductase [Chloroflexi bacterium]|nr:SDR family oxidoreductase [Chloroflexota bacterium]MBP8058568.1 SDR family oxidoreductase [Chloroflexota bacterium]